MADNVVKPERPGGFLDFLPPDYLAREKMLGTIQKIFRSFGFDPIETPRIEFLKTLAGETSDTGKNIFHIKSTHDDEPLAIPFDHTVPFARILAANPYNAKKRTGIRLPWRRMVVGPVFRADTPQSGRYRQFYQFDADIAGTSSMLADAEIVAIMFLTMEALGVKKFKIRLNNRKILNGLAILADIHDRGEVKADDITKEMMRILDKIDKIGLEKVLAELQSEPKTPFDPAPALSEDAIVKIRAFLDLKGSNEEKLKLCGNVFQEISVAEEGIDELRQILDYIAGMGIPAEAVDIDFSIARGLDYYTGPVMETILLDAPEFGSVFGGGRYNGLVSRFTGAELPATGSSIGVDRLFAALSHLGAIDRAEQTVTEVMVLRLEKDRDADYLQMAAELRGAGMNAEVCLADDTTFKNQFNFAITRGMKFAIICGGNEFETQTVQVKNLQTRKQEEIPRNEMIHYFKREN
ncbi:histidine--tRNA ligase [Desulfonema magnum]|uniref:Histidine--tRNA ligase n=1 Tax=Desulfonema magnum TaxID=45655 RepID=A0A975BRZ3_9BACT|nr:histidine--tRNA ligase [Desulfonema magnum]QTA90546.1 Histidine--tRNA ligase [Desulfonema magnum]